MEEGVQIDKDSFVELAFAISDTLSVSPLDTRGLMPLANQASEEILRPFRDALIEGGMTVSEIRSGKPWGGGFTVGEGESRVSLYLAVLPEEGGNHWTAYGHILTVSSSWWTILPGVRDEVNPLQIKMRGRVIETLKRFLGGNLGVTGVRWRKCRPGLADEEGWQNCPPGS